MKFKVGDKVIANTSFSLYQLGNQILIVKRIDTQFKQIMFNEKDAINNLTALDYHWNENYFHKLTKAEIRKLEGFNKELETILNE